MLEGRGDKRRKEGEEKRVGKKDCKSGKTRGGRKEEKEGL